MAGRRIKWGLVAEIAVACAALAMGSLSILNRYSGAIDDIIAGFGKGYYKPDMTIVVTGQKYSLASRDEIMVRKAKTDYRYDLREGMVYVDGPGDKNTFFTRRQTMEEPWERVRQAGCDIATREMKAAAAFNARTPVHTKSDDMRMIEELAAIHCPALKME